MSRISWFFRFYASNSLFSGVADTRTVWLEETNIWGYIILVGHTLPIHLALGGKASIPSVVSVEVLDRGGITVELHL